MPIDKIAIQIDYGQNDNMKNDYSINLAKIL
jgi:hypothetical protein